MLGTALLLLQLCLNLANLCAFTSPNISIKMYVNMCTCVILSMCCHFHRLFFIFIVVSKLDCVDPHPIPSFQPQGVRLDGLKMLRTVITSKSVALNTKPMLFLFFFLQCR